MDQEPLAQNEKLALLMQELRQHTGTAAVKIHFDGSGDSGQIGDIEVVGLIVDLAQIPAPTPLWAAWCMGGMDARTKMPSTMHDVLEHAAYDLLDNNSNVDWVNNDGGHGTIVIEPYSGKVELTVIGRFQPPPEDMDPEITDLSIELDPSAVQVTQEGNNG